ncbi:hypothetical protein [Spiroplasma endosymbiont of Calodromius spilotus]|uniref:hypothetical protein n=1 Tax=Spiroplasma endosymbiont of Calodromius spilotus TaxID=3077929 RepID=UPI0031FEDFBE
MKILNIIALSTLTILPIVGCSKKENKSVEQKNETNNKKDKIYDFKIKGLEKVKFLILKNNNQLFVVNIDKKDNINLNEKLSELKDLNTFTFWFTKEFENSQSKQKEIKQLITTHGQKMPDAHHNIPYRGVKRPHEVWIIDKKITIKAQGTDFNNFKVDNITDYRLQETNDFEIEIENQ